MLSQMPNLRLPISLGGKFSWLCRGSLFAFCPAPRISAEGKSCNTFWYLTQCLLLRDEQLSNCLLTEWVSWCMKCFLSSIPLATSLVPALITSHLGCGSHLSTGCSVCLLSWHSLLPPAPSRQTFPFLCVLYTSPSHCAKPTFILLHQSFLRLFWPGLEFIACAIAG